MKESDIRNHIKSKFTHVKLERFEFLTTVGDDFVVPDISNFNFLILKHIWKAGPIYVRSLVPIPTKLDDESDDDDDDDNGDIENDDYGDNYHDNDHFVTTTKDIENFDHGAKGIGLSYAGAKNTKLSYIGAKDTRISHAPAENTELCNAGPKQAVLSYDRVKDTGLSYVRAEDTGLSYVRSKDTGLSYIEAKDTEAKDTEAKDTGAKDTGAKDTGAKDTEMHYTEIAIENTDHIKVKIEDDEPIIDNCATKPNTINPSSTITTCPVCFQSLPSKEFKSHVSACNGFIDFRQGTLNHDETNSLSNEEIASFSAESEKCRPVSELISGLKLGVGGKNEVIERLRVRRTRCWEDFADKLKKPWFTGTKHLLVTFIGESGVDEGGLCREFFTVAINQMKEILFVDGMPSKSTMLLTNKQFLYAGKLLSLSLLHCGRDPNILNESCYRYLVGNEDIEVPSSFKERDEVKKLLAIQSDEELRKILMEKTYETILTKIGFRGLVTQVTIDTRDEIIKAYHFKEEFEPFVGPLKQLADGIDPHLLNLMRKYPESFKNCFVVSPAALTYDEFTDLLQIRFSEDGSSRKMKEIDIHKYFDDFIENCFYNEKSAVKLEDVLQFITGSPIIPAGGFSDSLSVKFNHNCSSVCKCLPEASLCDLSISLPMHIESADEMIDIMSEAIKGSVGFSRC